MEKLILLVKRIYVLIRFGKVSEHIVDTINGIPCEIAYYGRSGEIIGYWAYGSWDPKFAYKGIKEEE